MVGYVTRKMGALMFITLMLGQVLMLSELGITDLEGFYGAVFIAVYVYAFAPEIKMGLSDAYEWYHSRGGGS